MSDPIVRRWVCREKSTGFFATSRSGRYSPNIKFDGDLQQAKIYRTRNGAIPYGAKSEDYEWLSVLLIIEQPQ